MRFFRQKWQIIKIKKMLREIANDNITPKKRDSLGPKWPIIWALKTGWWWFEDEGLDYDTDMIPLAEF